MEDRRLLQEILVEQDPTGWRMLVGCMLLNLTSRRQVDRVWPELFKHWPTPERAAECSLERSRFAHTEVYLNLALLGLQRRRYVAITTFSQQWLDCGSDAQGLHERNRKASSMGFYGVGEYGRDSWLIFMRHEIIIPDDKELRKYLGLPPILKEATA